MAGLVSLATRSKQASRLPHPQSVEALWAAGDSGFVDPLNGCVGAGNVVANGEPHAGLQVGAAFHRVGAAQDAGESQFDIGVGGSDGTKMQCARSIQRVGAAGALNGADALSEAEWVEGAVILRVRLVAEYYDRL